MAFVLILVFAAWALDSVVRGNAVRPALQRAGFGETIMSRNLIPRHCAITDYEAVFWGNGRTTGEAQGYVCVSHFGAPEVHRISFDEDLGADLFSEI